MEGRTVIDEDEDLEFVYRSQVQWGRHYECGERWCQLEKKRQSEEERAWCEIRLGAWIQLLYFRCMTVVWCSCEYDASCELEMPHYAIVVPDNPS